MNLMQRYRITSTGTTGLPGYTNLYFDNVAAFPPVPAIRAAFAAAAGLWPQQVTYHFPGTGDLVQDTDGKIIGTWATDAGADVVGTSTSGFAAPAGFIAEWTTSNPVAGRRPLGKTFIVPGGGDSYQNDGTVVASSLSALTAFANSLKATNRLVVWSRPEIDHSTTPPTVVRPGSSQPVTGIRVPD